MDLGGLKKRELYIRTLETLLKCFALKVTDMYSLLYLFFVLFISCCGTVLIADACFFRGPSCKSVWDSLFPGCLSPVTNVFEDDVDDNDGDYDDDDDSEGRRCRKKKNRIKPDFAQFYIMSLFALMSVWKMNKQLSSCVWGFLLGLKGALAHCQQHRPSPLLLLKVHSED